MWLKIIGAIASGVALIAAGVAAKKLIDKQLIKKEIKNRNAAAFKAVIQAKKKKSVKVGVWDNYNDEPESMELKSEEGVSEDIYVGQILYL